MVNCYQIIKKLSKGNQLLFCFFCFFTRGDMCFTVAQESIQTSVTNMHNTFSAFKLS